MIARGRRLSAVLPGLWDRRVRELGKAVVNYRGARRAYARQALFQVLGRGSDLLLAPFGSGQLLVPADDLEIGRVVFATGGYERLYMACAVRELRRHGHSVEGRTFVDVGANIGTSTVDALLEFGFGRAVCFEPDDRSFRLLRANLALNGLENRTTTHPVALSATDGVSLLQMSPTNRADNRLVVESGPARSPRSDLVSVSCRRFDSLVDEGVLEPHEVGLLWIDAQGHEAFVLEGAARAMEAGIPIVLEYTPADLRANGTLGRLHNLLSAHYTAALDLHLLAAGLGSDAVVATGELGTLRGIDEREHTDLLLLRAPPEVVRARLDS